MQLRWSAILALIGLFLFTAVAYRSMPANHHEREAPRRYYWWSSLRLDSDPLDRNPAPAKPCPEGIANCSNGETPNVKIAPGWLEKFLVVSPFPPFLPAFPVLPCLTKPGIDARLT